MYEPCFSGILFGLKTVFKSSIYTRVGRQGLTYCHYVTRKTLQIARQLGERALEAQACYSLGNTYTLMRDYHLAIQYHVQHLRIAQELHDRVGESRACWSLGNAHTALGNHQKALQYASKHLEIAKEVSHLNSSFGV